MSGKFSMTGYNHDWVIAVQCCVPVIVVIDITLVNNAVMADWLQRWLRFITDIDEAGCSSNLLDTQNSIKVIPSP